MNLNLILNSSTPFRAESCRKNVTARLSASNLVGPACFRTNLAKSVRMCAARAAFCQLLRRQRRRPRRFTRTLGLSSGHLEGPSDALPGVRERAAPPRLLRHAHVLGASRPRRPPARTLHGRGLHTKEHECTQFGPATSSPPLFTPSSPRATCLSPEAARQLAADEVAAEVTAGQGPGAQSARHARANGATRRTRSRRAHAHVSQRRDLPQR